MKNAIDEALEDASAEAAFDALSRHEQGLAQPEESAFTDAEIEAMAKLRPAADPGRDAAWQAAMATALGAADQGAAIPTRGRGSVSPLRFLTRARVSVAAGLALAAGLAVVVVQPQAFEGEVGQALLSAGGDRVLGPSQPAAPNPSPITLSGCVNLNVPIKSASPLSDPPTAHAYWQRGSQTVRWNVVPQVAEQKLALQCAPLPAELSAGDWTLVLLVGYPGRLHWLGSDPVTKAAPGPSTSYRGIQVVRQAVSIASTP